LELHQITMHTHRSRVITAGRESHPALKMNQYLFLQIHFNGFHSKMQALSFTF
jgi:hypothetical protein